MNTMNFLITFSIAKQVKWSDFIISLLNVGLPGQVKDIILNGERHLAQGPMELSYSTVVLHIGIMKVWDFIPQKIIPKPPA